MYVVHVCTCTCIIIYLIYYTCHVMYVHFFYNFLFLFFMGKMSKNSKYFFLLKIEEIILFFINKFHYFKVHLSLSLSLSLSLLNLLRIIDVAWVEAAGRALPSLRHPDGEEVEAPSSLVVVANLSFSFLVHVVVVGDLWSLVVQAEHRELV